MIADAAVAERVLTSNELVEQLISMQNATVGELALLGVQPELAIITTCGWDPAIKTYWKSKERHAAKVGIGFNPVECVDEDEALLEIAYHNESDQTNGIVMQLPVNDRNRTQELCDAVTAIKDVDALSRAGKEFFDPPTARAAIELARYHTNGFEGIGKYRVAVVGALGRLVGSGAVTMLKDEGFEPKLIDKANKGEVQTLGRDADLIITATGIPGSINPRHLRRPRKYQDLPLVIIDGGIGVGKDGRPAQDLPSDVFNLPHVRATKRMKAVGPLAVALMVGNVIEAAKLQLPRDLRVRLLSEI